MKALVLGRGRSGRAAAKLLEARGFEVAFAGDCDLVVASPGISVKSELQLGCEELRRRGVKLLAVTGSKGKSSVVKLMAEALGGIPCGNYGLPVSAVGDCKWAVVEVSSFQLETTALPPDTFEAAAILNLQHDHLDRHGSAEVYHALKRRLLAMTRRPVELTDELRAAAPLLAGSYFDNGVLRGNGCLAIGMLRLAGLSDERIAAAFRDFEPLPHRMNLVAETGGVRWVDDSKATSVAALAAGVSMCGDRPVRLIAGGLPKGDDPADAIPALTDKVIKVYLIGQCAESFARCWQAVADCEICGAMAVAVAAAKREAKSGETVLLSPGAASYDQFESFEERGECFVQLVRKENNDK